MTADAGRDLEVLPELTDAFYEYRWARGALKTRGEHLVLPGWPTWLNTQKCFSWDNRTWLEVRLARFMTSHLELFPDDAETAQPKITETFTGRKDWRSVLGNADVIYITRLGPNYNLLNDSWKLPMPQCHDILSEFLEAQMQRSQSLD